MLDISYPHALRAEELKNDLAKSQDRFLGFYSIRCFIGVFFANKVLVWAII